MIQLREIGGFGSDCLETKITDFSYMEHMQKNEKDIAKFSDQLKLLREQLYEEILKIPCFFTDYFLPGVDRLHDSNEITTAHKLSIQKTYLEAKNLETKGHLKPSEQCEYEKYLRAALEPIVIEEFGASLIYVMKDKTIADKQIDENLPKHVMINQLIKEQKEVAHLLMMCYPSKVYERIMSLREKKNNDEYIKSGILSDEDIIDYAVMSMRLEAMDTDCAKQSLFKYGNTNVRKFIERKIEYHANNVVEDAYDHIGLDLIELTPTESEAYESKGELNFAYESIDLPYNSPTTEEMVIYRRLEEDCKNVLATLTSHERKVLRMRFGIGGEDEHSLDEIADDFSVSRVRIREIETRALKKLRYTNDSRSLKTYVQEY